MNGVATLGFVAKEGVLGLKTTRRQPQRTCIGCHETEGKRDLIRLVRTAAGSVKVDPSGREHGRGAYVHLSPECVRRGVRSENLARSLRMEPPGDESVALLLQELLRLAEEVAERG